MTIPQFRRWLEGHIATLQSLPTEQRQPTDHLQFKELVDEAYQYALELHLPDCAQACQPGPTAVVLMRVLGAMPQAETLTVADVAQRLGVSTDAVYDACRDGRLPHTRIGTRIVITPDQLSQYRQVVTTTLPHLS